MGNVFAFTEYYNRKDELTNKFGPLQQKTENPTERKEIYKQYLSAIIQLAKEHGKKEHAADLQKMLNDYIRMDNETREMEQMLKNMDRDYNKLI
jgi:hypothetical protein